MLVYINIYKYIPICVSNIFSHTSEHARIWTKGNIYFSRAPIHQFKLLLAQDLTERFFCD